MVQLLKHPQIIPHGKVLDDFPFLHPKAVNMLHLECLPVGSQSGSLDCANKTTGIAFSARSSERSTPHPD